MPAFRKHRRVSSPVTLSVVMLEQYVIACLQLPLCWEYVHDMSYHVYSAMVQYSISALCSHLTESSFLPHTYTLTNMFQEECIIIMSHEHNCYGNYMYDCYVVVWENIHLGN